MCAAPDDTKAKPEATASEKARPDAKDEPAAPTLRVEKKGSYVYWFTYKDAEGQAQATLPARFKGKSTDVGTSDLGAKFTGAKLFVMNKGTGNLAISDYPASKETKDVDLAADDFTYVRTVRLRIVGEDKKPVESAIVHITDGMSTDMSALVTPADEGVATFSNVASGEIEVRVDAENLRKTLDSDVYVPEKRDTPGFERDIKVSGDVRTLDIAPEAAKGQSKRPSGGTGIKAILAALAGFFVLILIIAIVVIILKVRGFTGKSALQGLGVELPGDAGSQGAPGVPAGPAIDPSICQFCGQRKDASGNCACSVLPGAAPASPMQTSTGVPRLVGVQGVYSGHIFEISGPSMIVGREPDNPIALPNDSTASRRHATISQADGGCAIRDEGSSNGTFVNGAKITEQKLAPGDEIQIGGTKFRFEV